MGMCRKNSWRKENSQSTQGAIQGDEEANGKRCDLGG